MAHDGTSVLFLSKTFGDAMEIEHRDRMRSARSPPTSRTHGFTRTLYLSDGDYILLSGPPVQPDELDGAQGAC